MQFNRVIRAALAGAALLFVSCGGLGARGGLPGRGWLPGRGGASLGEGARGATALSLFKKSSGASAKSTASAAGGTVVFSGATDLTGWDVYVTAGADAFAGARAGSRLLVTTKASKRAKGYIKLKLYAPTDNGWQELNAGAFGNAVYSDAIEPAAADQTLSYTLTAHDAQILAQYGFILHGYGVVVTKIVLADGGAQPTGSGANPADSAGSSRAGASDSTGASGGTAAGSAETVLFSGARDFSAWDIFVTAGAESFAGAQAGSKIAVTTRASPTAKDYQNLKLYAATPSGWQELRAGALSGATYAGAVVPDAAAQTFTYTLTAADAQKLAQYGFVLQGYGVVVTRVVLAGGGASGAAAQKSGGSGANPGAASGTGASSASSAKSSAQAPAGTPYAVHGALSVRGTDLVDSSGAQFQLYGMSTHGIADGWFPQYVNREAFRTLRDDWGTNCVRLAMYTAEYNGYCTGGNKESLKKLVCAGVDAATELGMYVIVDWHVLNDSTPQRYKAQAKEFFAEISARYKGNGNVLYEICNEPCNGTSWADIKSYAEEIIPVIRANAPGAVVLVGTPTWSQELDKATASPLTLPNVMYSFHFYADTHRAPFRTSVEKALAAGTPVFITEFGTCDASGNGGLNTAQSREWFSLIARYNLSHINWNLSNKNETSSVIAPQCFKTSGWGEGDLTESGRFIRAHFRELK